MDFRYVMFGLLLTPFVSAAPLFLDEYKDEGLNAAMDDVICRTEFSVGVLESHMEVLGAEELQDNIEELHDLADDGDYRGFKEYMHGSYVPHMREAKDEALEARMEADISPEMKAELREDYAELRDEFDECHFKAMKEFAEAKINGYNAILDRAQEHADNLSAKGVETSGLDALLDEAKEDIVDPLQEAVNEAETGADIRMALGDYCMFDGCMKGTNFHLAAKWHIEKLDKILELIEDDAEEAGLEEEWDEAKAYVEAADEALDEVGDAKYTDGQHAAVWDNIRAASEALKSIISELRSG